MQKLRLGTAVALTVAFSAAIGTTGAAASDAPTTSEHDVGAMISYSCRADYTSLDCETASVPASRGEVIISIIKPISTVPCNYIVKDVANGARVREGTFWYGNAWGTTLKKVYSRYSLRIWGCSPWTEGSIDG